MPVILADEHIYGLHHLKKYGFEVLVIKKDIPLQIQATNCDALLIRTVHKINKASIPTLPKHLKFVGTATAGTDHLDTRWLEENGIRWAHSPGCNAQAVAEYVVTGMLYACDFKLDELRKRTVGIIGHGNTGGKVSRLLTKLGVNWVACDPPRSEKYPDFDYVSLEDALLSDIITLHVPLTSDGNYPTVELINKDSLHNKSIDLLINAARGGVTIEEHILWGLDKGFIKQTITDVWKNEPEVHPVLLQNSLLSTPHIAGYSLQGKMEATRMVCQQLLDFFGIKDVFTFGDEHPNNTLETADATPGLINVLPSIHPMFELSRALKNDGSAFSTLRNGHTLRNEYEAWSLKNVSKADIKLAEGLGFGGVHHE